METKQRTLLLKYLHSDKETTDLQKEFKSPHFISFFLNFIHSKSHQLFELNSKANVKSQDVEKLVTKPSTANQRQVERISTPKALTASPQTSYNDGFQQHRDHINRSAYSGKKKNRKPLNRSRQENSNDGHRNLKIDPKTPVFGDYLTKTTKPSVFNCTEQVKEVSLLKTSKSFDVSNSEDFPSLSSSAPQPKTDETKKSKRRIKPTLVSSSVSTEKCKLVFDSFSSPTLPSGSNVKLPDTAKQLQEEKEILLKTRIFNAEKSTTVKIAASLDKQLECISPIQADATTPIQQPRTTVTNSFIKEIKRFASLFAHLVAQFLVPSIVEELHLVVMLLTLDPSLEGSVEVNRNQQDDDLSPLLRTTNEGFIFATEAILHLSHTLIIEVFNKEMLQLLHSAIQAKEQCNDLLMKLTSMIKTRSTAKLFHKKTLNFGAVEFKLDADERSNFVSDKSFQGFKKQRDLFYEIMEEWRGGGEPSHKDTTRKVHWLVSQVKNFSTYEPFIRLFLDNLILAGNKKLPPKRDTPHPSLVTGDPERLRLLESRVTTPTQPRMTSSHGWLSAELQFFREFVKTSDSFSLNLYLLHGIKERIVAMETNMDTMDHDHNRNLIK
nr:codanin-1 [Ciona intestinalis]|eukprot:XP_002127267.2 codanin-1 [Ciona intestinalis]